MPRWAWSWGWTLVLAGCPRASDPEHAFGDPWRFGEMGGRVEACDAQLVAELRGSELGLDDWFPPMTTRGTSASVAQLLGARVPLVVEADRRAVRAHPVDPHARSRTMGGHEWRIQEVEYQDHDRCDTCENQVVVRLDAGPTCEPWLVYR